MKHSLPDIQNRFNRFITNNPQLLNLSSNHEFAEVPMRILQALHGNIPRFCVTGYALSKINECEFFSLVSKYLEDNGFALVINHREIISSCNSLEFKCKIEEAKINLYFNEEQKIMVYYSYIDEIIGIVFYNESMDFITSIMDSFYDLLGKPKCSYITYTKKEGDDFKVGKFVCNPLENLDTDTQHSKDNTDTATNIKRFIKSLTS